MIEGFIYTLYDGDEVIYVGQAQYDPMYRIRAHLRKGWKITHHTIETTEGLREEYHLPVDLGIDELEGLMIALRQPALNKRGPDLVARHQWPPGAREETPRRRRAKEVIRLLRSHKR